MRIGNPTRQAAIVVGLSEDVASAREVCEFDPTQQTGSGGALLAPNA